MDNLQEAVRLVQNFFKNGGTIKEFKEKCGVLGKTDGELLILDYGIDADWSTPYPWVCRGLILDANTYDIVAFGLPKFWNSSERAAAKIDWSDAIIFEKMDGTMVQRYWHPYKKAWAYSTRFQLPGDLQKNRPTSISNETWQQLIDKTVGAVADSIGQEIDETTVWEAMSPDNTVVVQHAYHKASLLCARNIKSFKEKDLRSHPLAPKTFKFSSLKEVEEYVNGLNGLTSEGVVVCDHLFNRVKVKGRDYVLKHHSLDNVLRSASSLVEFCYTTDVDEFLSYFPHVAGKVRAVNSEIEIVIKELEEIYAKVSHLEDRKLFALELKKHHHQNINHLFGVRDSNVSVREYIYQLPVKNFVKMFEGRVKARLSI